MGKDGEDGKQSPRIDSGKAQAGKIHARRRICRVLDNPGWLG